MASVTPLAVAVLVTAVNPGTSKKRDACAKPKLCVVGGAKVGWRIVIGAERRCEGGGGRVAFLATSDDGRSFSTVPISVLGDGAVTLVVSPKEGIVLAVGTRESAGSLPFALRSEDGGKTFVRTRLPIPGTPAAVRVHGTALELLVTETSSEGEVRTWVLGSDDLAATWSQAKPVVVDAAWTQDPSVSWADLPSIAGGCAPAPAIVVGASKPGRLLERPKLTPVARP
jgi:hypothetical protein